MSIATKCTCGGSFTFCNDHVAECHHRIPPLTPPSPEQGVMARWVKASERLPKYPGDPQIHYRLDGFHKVLGNFYHNDSNELVFGVIGVTHKNYDIPREKWAGIEWLDELPAPPTPVDTDFETSLSKQVKEVGEGSTASVWFQEGAEWARDHFSKHLQSQQAVRWVTLVGATVDGFQLCRLIGTTEKFPAMIAPYVITDMAGKTYKRDELEYLIDSPAPEQVDPVKLIDWVQSHWPILRVYKPDAVVEKYTASLQNKQP